MNKKITITELIKSTSILDVATNFLKLQKYGSNYLGLCPFHNDTNPSLSISPSKNLFKCFSCLKSGNVIELIKEYNNFSYYQAVEYLAKMQNVEIDIKKPFFETIHYSDDENQIIEAMKDAMNIFSFTLFNEQIPNLEYFLEKRKLNIDIIKNFDIGYADSNYLKILTRKHHTQDILINAALSTEKNTPFFQNRIIFGIKNINGDLIGFSGRNLDDNNKFPKYLNSSESSLFQKSTILYNFHKVKDYQEVILVEGFMDVIAYYKDDIKNVAALMGNSLTQHHLKILKNKKVILNLDGDEAGMLATLKASQLLLKNNINVEVIKNQEKFDPDELLSKNGKGFLKQQLQINKISGIDFLIESCNKKIDINNYESVNTFISLLKPILNNFDEIKQKFYFAKINRILKFDVFTHSNQYKLNKESIMTNNNSELKNFNNKTENKTFLISTKLKMEITFNKAFKLDGLNKPWVQIIGNVKQGTKTKNGEAIKAFGLSPWINIEVENQILAAKLKINEAEKNESNSRFQCATLEKAGNKFDYMFDQFAKDWILEKQSSQEENIIPKSIKDKYLIMTKEEQSIFFENQKKNKEIKNEEQKMEM